MNRAITYTALMLLLAGCGAVSVGKNPGTNPVETQWYENGQKKSEKDLSRGVFTEWYENGRIKFRAREWLGVESAAWIPAGNNGRIITRINADPGYPGRFYFIYDERYKSQVRWGSYNIYEGWYPDGQEKFVYNYTLKRFTEWDANGRVTERRKE